MLVGVDLLVQGLRHPADNEGAELRLVEEGFEEILVRFLPVDDHAFEFGFEEDAELLNVVVEDDDFDVFVLADVGGELFEK